MPDLTSCQESPFTAMVEINTLQVDVSSFLSKSPKVVVVIICIRSAALLFFSKTLRSRASESSGFLASRILLLALHDVLRCFEETAAAALRDDTSHHDGFAEATHHRICGLILSHKHLRVVGAPEPHEISVLQGRIHNCHFHRRRGRKTLTSSRHLLLLRH